jgi:basic amino acid/polyamine antiporter, APA family
LSARSPASDPTRSYPFALFAGILIAGAIYFLVTFAASLVVPTEQLTESDGPLLEVVRDGSSIPTRVFSAIALLAIANGALINMIMASRLLFGMSREEIMPGVLGRAHEGRRTPWVAIIFTTLIAVVLISIGTLEELAATTVILLLFVFTMVNIAVLVLRRESVDHAHFTTPRILPVLGMVISVVLAIKLATDQDLKVLVITVVVLAVGVLLWVGTRRLGTEGGR